MNETSPGLLNLTRIVLTRTFGEKRLEKLTNEHMEVLAAIVAHHGLFGLSAREQDVLSRRFCGGKTYRAIGEELGITPSPVRQIVLRALTKLTRAARADLVKTKQDIETERGNHESL